MRHRIETSRSRIEETRNAARMRDLRPRANAPFRQDPDHGEIRGVPFKDRRGPGPDRARVTRGVRPFRRPAFAKPRARLPKDAGHAKAPADLDELAAAHDALASRR